MRIEPPTVADERTTLTAFLDWYRGTLATKCADLDAGQLATRSAEPSSLSLLGLVRHMAEVERSWFRGFAGEPTQGRYFTKEDPDGDFDNVAAEDAMVTDAMSYWEQEMAHAREVVAAHDLDDTFTSTRSQREFSLRWVLVHMIEEYARHCGHADLIRERIDGATGD
jgi:uncharacterized damage-inducible protein DinB